MNRQQLPGVYARKLSPQFRHMTHPLDTFCFSSQFGHVVITDFPDEATATQAILPLAESGHVTTETRRAFTFHESRDIVDPMS